MSKPLTLWSTLLIVLNVCLALLAAIAIVGNLISGVVPVLVIVMFWIVAAAGLNLGMFQGRAATLFDIRFGMTNEDDDE